MSAMAIGCIVFACVFGGALLGMLLRAVLPALHRDADSKELMKLGMSRVAHRRAGALFWQEVGEKSGMFQDSYRGSMQSSTTVSE
jgi:hypothetical protein